MAINTYPAVASPVKSVQRGSAAGAGTVTITAVDISKSMVNSFSQGAAGTVATNSTSSASTTLSPSGGSTPSFGYGYTGHSGTQISGSMPNYTGSVAVTLTGGTMDATTKQMGAYLTNSTTLTVTGACQWEVVEFN